MARLKLSPVAVDFGLTGPLASKSVQAAGNFQLVSARKLGLMCSSQCPGSLVLKTYDLVRDLRDQGRVMAGGFHSPMERECLGILLRGQQAIVICPARNIDGMQVPSEWADAYEKGRILVASTFDPKEKRITRTGAEKRNRLVCALAWAMIVPHAAPNSLTLELCKEFLAGGVRILTFDDPANELLIDLGAFAIGSNHCDLA